MSDLPTVTLAGKAYPIKPLVLRQLKVVDPAFARVRKDPALEKAETWDDMVEIVYQAIAPACDPPLQRAAFLDLPVTKIQLYQALPIIAQQAGMIAKDGATGEASQPTGTN